GESHETSRRHQMRDAAGVRLHAGPPEGRDRLAGRTRGTRYLELRKLSTPCHNRIVNLVLLRSSPRHSWASVASTARAGSDSGSLRPVRLSGSARPGARAPRRQPGGRPSASSSHTVNASVTLLKPPVSSLVTQREG